ncbi:hypothetical protein [Amycolatopsis plumensis]|uniref:Uncharacterized protein n=1 Tax=Amycolatopsis plumensis TaxID=236508 RepID=A0ABV5UHA0_9PSEU
MVGHTRTAEHSADAWAATWARRVLEVIEHPDAFSRPDWCGWPGFADRPTG